MYTLARNLVIQGKAYLTRTDLRGQALRGGIWLGIGTISAQLLRLVRNVVLARLLAPDSFGVMAIIISISFLMDTFTEIGVRESVIQNPNGWNDEYLNSAFWLSAGRSLLTYLAIFLLAPEVGSFYRNPELAALTRVTLLGVLLKGFMSPRAFISLKAMDYKRWTFLQYGSSVFASIITVIIAFFIRSVWALAIGFALEYLVLFAASYILFPFHPRVSMDKYSMRELLHFSKGVFGLSFLNLIYVRADIFVLGRVIPSDQLGIYTMAIYLAQVPAFFVMNYQAQILMPVFSQLQGDQGRTNSILAKSASALAFFLLPVLIFVALSGHALLTLLYGGVYARGFWPLLIAAVIGFVNIANAQLTTAFYAAGKPHLHRVCLFAMSALVAVLVYPAARYLGTTGAQLTALLAIIVGYSIQLRQARSLTGFRLNLSKRLSLQIAGAVVVLVAAVLLRGKLVFPTPEVGVAVGLLAAVLFLVASALLSYRQHQWNTVAT